MGTQGTGRKRSTKKERSTAEDDALNLIAREAEARLAAKRAARAEAREIRMKELERQQKELSDEDERMSVGSRGSVRVEDRDYLEKGSRAASALTAGTLTSLGGTSSRRGSGETALTVDAESSIREIKDALAEVEEKYRKAMVSNAQLDNEKNNLMYQVDTLKDSLMELEELLSESRREYEEKVKEYEREKHAHGVLQFQFNEMKETLKQSEELLNDIRQLRMKQDGFVREISDLQETVEWKDKKIGALERQKEYTDAIRIERDELREEVVQLKDILKKHGIVLGPDLNINGDVGESEVDGSPGADSASRPAQESQTSPTEGNSMLGNTEDTELRSSREEEVEPEQQQEMLQEVKENHLSSENDSLNSTLCNVADVDTSSEKQLSEEQRVNLSTEEDGIRQSGLSNDSPTTEAKDVIVCSSEPQHIHPVTSPEENVAETEISEGGNLKETRHSDLGETETKNDSVDTHSDVRDTCTNLDEKQDNKQEGVENSDLSNTEPCPQQKATQDVMKESVSDESVPAVSNTEPQQEPENADEADNIGAEDVPSKSASGKKKKKKKRGKKKGGSQDNKNQQKDGTNKENKTDKDEGSATRNDGSTAEPKSGGPVTEIFEESKVDQDKKEQDKQESMDADAVEPAEPTETFSNSEAVKEPRTDHSSNENDQKQTSETKTLDDVGAVNLSVVNMDQIMDKQNEEQTLETETVESVEAVEHTERFSHVDSLKESRTDSNNNGQDKEQTQETETVESVEVMEPSAETIKETRTDSKYNGQDKEQTLETETVESVEAVESPAESLKETRTDSKNKGQDEDEEQTLETMMVESVEAVEPPAETLKETRTDSKNNGQDKEQTLETGVVESAEAVEPPAETLKEFRTDSKKNEQDGKKTSDTENEEECETIPSLDPETSLCKSDFNSKSIESTDGLDTKSVDDSESEVICTKSEIVDQVEAEVESADEMKPECTTEKPENMLETCSKESAEVESHISDNDGVAANESEFINSSESKDNTSVSLPSTEDFNDDFKSLSESEPLTAMNLGNDDPPMKDSDPALEEATEAIADDGDAGAEIEEECIHQGRTGTEDLNGDLKEPGDLVEPDCLLHDEKSDVTPSLTNTTEALDSEKSLEAVVENEQLDDAESKILDYMDPVEESNPEEKTEEFSMNATLDTPECPKEATENGSGTEQETDVPEDSDLKDSQHVKESELSVCVLDEQPHSSKDKSENNDLSQPTQLLSDDDDDGEEDEGMSFDFDDMDMEAAVESNLPENSEQEEIEEGVEVMSDETASGSSGLSQSNTQSNENTQVKPVESNDEKCTVDGDNQVDARDEKSNPAPQETQNSLVSVEAASEEVENVCEEDKNMPKEEAGVADDPRHIAEEGNVSSVGGLGAVAESIKQTVCSLVEEGLDVVRNELQVEGLDLPKSTDQVDSNKEAPQPGKDVKKSSKKGKGKGKEDCKMS